VQTQARQAHITFDNLHLFAEKITEAGAKGFLQAVQNRGLFDYFLKPPLRGRSAVAAIQQCDFADVRDLFEKVDHPTLADEAGNTDEQNVFALQSSPDTQSRYLRCAVKRHDRGRSRRSGTIDVLRSLLDFR